MIGGWLFAIPRDKGHVCNIYSDEEFPCRVPLSLVRCYDSRTLFLICKYWPTKILSRAEVTLPAFVTWPTVYDLQRPSCNTWLHWA